MLFPKTLLRAKKERAQVLPWEGVESDCVHGLTANNSDSLHETVMFSVQCKTDLEGILQAGMPETSGWTA